MNALYNRFLKNAKKYPNNKCLTDSNQSIDYQKAVELIKKNSSLIKNFKNTSAIIYLPKSIDIVLWQLAMNANNIAFITLEWGQESRINSTINKCRPSLMITLINNQISIIHYDNYISYNNCDYIVFSSGSTGEPKKILLQDNPVVDVVEQQAKITNMNSHSSFLWILNPAFDASLSDIYMTLFSGGHLVVSNTKPSDIKEISRLIFQHNITHIDMPPVIFKIFLKFYLKNKDLFTSLKHIVFGGEKADENITKKLSLYFKLYNAYGPTETTICSSLSFVDKDWTSNNIGKPLFNVEYKIVNNELHIGGEHCAIGYDDSLLDKRFYIKDEKKWFMSGDIVECKNNIYYYLGRKDRQFKYNGQLICPEEIESIAQKCGADFAKISFNNNKITLKYTGNFEKELLKKYLPTWMIPHHFEVMELKINSNWKVI